MLECSCAGAVPWPSSAAGSAAAGRSWAQPGATPRRHHPTVVTQVYQECTDSLGQECFAQRPRRVGCLAAAGQGLHAPQSPAAAQGAGRPPGSGTSRYQQRVQCTLCSRCSIVCIRAQCAGVHPWEQQGKQARQQTCIQPHMHHPRDFADTVFTKFKHFDTLYADNSCLRRIWGAHGCCSTCSEPLGDQSTCYDTTVDAFISCLRVGCSCQGAAPPERVEGLRVFGMA